MKKLFFIIMSFMMILTGIGCSDTRDQQVATDGQQELSGKDSQQQAIFPEEELPSAYSLMDVNEVPQVRNQKEDNTCWAYASLSALESSKDEDAAETYSIEHLLKYNPYQKEFEEGGSYVVSMAYLLGWMGPVSVETESLNRETISAEIHVQEIRQIEPKDYTAIKRFVYLYGGVESALYLDFDGGTSESECYNSFTNAYCYLGDRTSNHEVVIIGWDDEYPAENFKGTVSADGAFLCQNSWGEEFGNQGTFYVSYEDANIGGYGVAYSRIDSADNYDRIYQSDLCGYTAQIGYNQETCWFANVYKAEDSITLRAAGFYATGKETNYEIYVVNEFQDQSSLNDRQPICKGALQDAGYYTIDFPESLKIDEGNEFALIVRITTKGAEYPVAVECAVEGFSEYADISDGKGYLSYQGTMWEHMESTKQYNICLKAYADLQ